MSADVMEARMRGYQSRVQAVLDAALPAADLVPQRLHAAQRYAVLGRGKRLRPLLVYCTGEALRVPANILDAPAAAVELIHSYSLVHDDLPAMDDDDLRRGQPTTHRAFDEATAILAGDALQVLAFSLLSRDRTPGVSGDARLKMIQILADARHRLKTGALIRASVLMAAACAPALSAANWDALDGYAQDIGLAFQIQDDILDVEGKTEETGKTSGADAARAKPTYPSVLGLEAAKIRARELKLRACERLTPLGEGARVLAWLASYVIQRRV